MKLHKIFIICALVHALPTCGAAALAQKAQPKAYSGAIEKTSPTKAAQAFDPALTEQFFKLVKINDQCAHSFFDQYKTKINVDYQDGEGETLLMWASWYHNDTLAKKLLDQKANCQIVDKFGRTALHNVFVCWKFPTSFESSKKIIKLLLAAKSDVNKQTTSGSTPLIWAIRTGCGHALTPLLEHGADITLQTTYKASQHPFIPNGTAIKNAPDCARVYKQYAPTFADCVVADHMIKTLEKHQKKRTEHLNILGQILPLDLILIIGKYDRG